MNATSSATKHDYTQLWEEMFASRSWGRYPPEDLVRFMGRRFKGVEKSNVRVLEIGCGPGANLWFLHREGYQTCGIDASKTAIEQANARLAHENAYCKSPAFDLKVGNFAALPWEDASIDVVIDIFALYANTPEVIQSAAEEIYRVLKPSGVFYSKLWGTQTTGCGEGNQIDNATYDAIPSGPCRDMGVSRFFDQDAIQSMFGEMFEVEAVDRIWRSDIMADQEIEEFHCQFKKAC